MSFLNIDLRIIHLQLWEMFYTIYIKGMNPLCLAAAAAAAAFCFLLPGQGIWSHEQTRGEWCVCWQWHSSVSWTPNTNILILRFLHFLPLRKLQVCFMHDLGSRGPCNFISKLLQLWALVLQRCMHMLGCEQVISPIENCVRGRGIA